MYEVHGSWGQNNHVCMCVGIVSLQRGLERGQVVVTVVLAGCRLDN